MSAQPRRFFDLYGVLRILVALVIFITLSFIPIRGTPSVADWVQAYIRGEGQPHFVIAGTPEGRINELFARTPELDPEWRDVPPEENGYVLLRKFADSKAATNLALSPDMRIMLTEDWKWNENAALQFLEKNREAVTELRRICLLPDQSAKGKSVKEVLKAPPNPELADALLLSLKQNLRAKRMTEALTDFTALYGFAAHLDQHEVPNFKDKAAAVQVRLAPQDSVCKALKDASANMDWKPWMRVLQNVPSYGQQMQAAWRGEAWAEFLMAPVWRTIDRKKKYDLGFRRVRRRIRAQSAGKFEGLCERKHALGPCWAGEATGRIRRPGNQAQQGSPRDAPKNADLHTGMGTGGDSRRSPVQPHHRRAAAAPERT